jgi:lysophospholipase L1-like esterase
MSAPRLRRVLSIAVAACLGGELSIRLFEALRPVPTDSLYSLVVPAEPRFVLRPSAHIIVPERYGDIEYQLNSRGFRDREHDPKSATAKIVLLGDSVTFGLGVRQDRTFAEIAGRTLAAESAGALETLNLAVFAYDTRDELMTLREEGLRYHPALVVLEFYLNDFFIESHTQPPAPTLGQRLTAARNAVLNRSALYRRLQQWTLGLSYLALHDVRRTRWPDSLNADEPRSKLAYLADHPNDATVTAFSFIRDIKNDTDAIHGGLLVLVSPDETQLYCRDWDAIQGRLRSFADREGIPLLDLLPILRADARPTALFLDGVHYSEYGHSRVAAALAPAISFELARRSQSAP